MKMKMIDHSDDAMQGSKFLLSTGYKNCVIGQLGSSYSAFSLSTNWVCLAKWVVEISE